MHHLKKRNKNILFKNIAGNKDCYILATKRNGGYSTHEIFSYPLNQVNVIYMLLCEVNKVKNVICKHKARDTDVVVKNQQCHVHRENNADATLRLFQQFL